MDEDPTFDARVCKYGVAIAVPGATFWRFWIEAEGPCRPDEDDLILTITPHVFDSAEEALDAADTWCDRTPQARGAMERYWTFGGDDLVPCPCGDGSCMLCDDNGMRPVES